MKIFSLGETALHCLVPPNNKFIVFHALLDRLSKFHQCPYKVTGIVQATRRINSQCRVELKGWIDRHLFLVCNKLF